MSLGAPSLQTNQKRESSAPFVATSAFNGLSVDPVSGKIVFGNDVAQAGDPAQLISSREILVTSLGTSFSIRLRQGPLGPSGFAIFGAAIDGNIGGLFHCFEAISDNDPGGTILYRGTARTANCFGAVIQLECSVDALAAVGQVGAFGSLGSVPAFMRGTFGLLSSNVIQPDIVLKASTKGAPGARPGRILFGTNTGAADVQTYSFLLPVLANLDFPNTLAQTSSDLTIAVPGAVDGDSVILAVPVASQVANTCYTAFVSAADTVTVRFNNYSAAAVNPAAGNFRVAVVKLL